MSDEIDVRLSSASVDPVTGFVLDYGEWEPNWCAACGNIAVTRSGAVCDICINEQAAFTELVQLGQEIGDN